MASRAAPALLGLLSCLGRALASCALPRVPSPYSREPNPFGWPVSPNQWEWGKSSEWPNRYRLCDGLRQSPIDVTLDGVDCGAEGGGPDGVLRNAASYNTVRGRPNVVVSDYMRSAFVEGDFGTLSLEDELGHRLDFEAVQVHLTTRSLHTVNGQEYDAELFVLHRPKGDPDPLKTGVMVSVLFSRSDDASSSIFEQMGFVNEEDMPVRDFSWEVQKVNLRAAMDDALKGPSYMYNGSIPVPPCSEMIKWFVLTKVQPVSKLQLQHLKGILECFAGGTKKRTPFPNPYKNQCRAILKNSLQIGGSHERPTCDETEKDGTWGLSARCWTNSISQEEQARCFASPVDIAHVEDVLPKALTSDMLHYSPVTEVLIEPTDYALNAVAVAPKSFDGRGEFGHVILNGRIFHARNVSIKAISMHTFNGTRYAGELTIEHDLFGDDIGDNDDELFIGTVRRLGHRLSGPHDKLHRVVVSIPLKLGTESALLRKLGFGDPANKHAVEAGHSYSGKLPVNLATDLQPSLSGNWYWYKGGSAQPGCPEWGVRWMVFETPMEVSLEQLNFLDLKVSGVDSSRVVRPAVRERAPDDLSGLVWRNHLPKFAVDTSESACDVGSAWGYDNPTCWKANFSVCGTGQMQSPINIDTSTITKVGKSNFLHKCSWKPVSQIRVTSTGFDLEVSNEQMGYVTITGADGFPSYYQVSGVQLHMPSEHMIDGKQFAAELHVVHQRQIESHRYDSNDLLIAAFLFDLGPDDSPILKQLYLPEAGIGDGSWRTARQPIDLMRAFGPALDGHFYRYNGSLTTPSCAETVKWFVFETPMKMSAAQWATFKALYPNPQNNRPIQMVNGRVVAKNSLEDGEPVAYRFYLSRNTGRNRKETSAAWIVLPVIGSIVLSVAIMLATFVQHDARRAPDSLSGLVATIGRVRYGRH